jgi:amidase
MTDLIWADAVDLLRGLAERRISSRELTSVTLERIESVNPVVNAIVSARPPDEVLADAAAADEATARGAETGALHGLPVAVKDLSDVIGLPTRRGSTTTSEQPAVADTLFVARLRAAGAVFVGKTNTPELGTGSHTFNEVFGVTRNPYDTSRSAGGSSGGAGAALASGMLALADGSDLGGSLRNPAAFCNVVGFRPSIGRVPRPGDRISFHPRLGVEGPMGRSVADVARLLSVMAGPDPRDPRSLGDPGRTFASPQPADPTGLRVAWGGDLDLFSVEAELMTVVETAVGSLESAGASVESAHPDLGEAMFVFRTHRALMYRDLGDQIPAEMQGELKDTIRWNIEAGHELTVADVLEAERARTRIHGNITEFFGRYDVLALPTTQVLPFPVEQEYPTEIDGRPMTDYLEWMSSCCVITATGSPAVSVPAGFSTGGLPVGLQLVGAPGADLRLLEIAAAVEAVTGRHGRVRPPEPIGAGEDRPLRES